MQGSANSDAGGRDHPALSDGPGTGSDTDTETERSNIRSEVEGPNSTSAASEGRMLQTLNTDDDSNNDDEDEDYEGEDEVGGQIAYAGESGDAAHTAITVSRHVEMQARIPKRTYNARKKNGAPKERHRCTFCPQYFQRAEHLRRHIKSKHDFHKEFCCDLCQKEFSRKDELLRHLRMHERRQDVPAETYAQANTPIPTPPIPPQPTQSRPTQKKKRISPLPLIVQIPNSQSINDTKAEVSGSAKRRSPSADNWTQTNLVLTEIPVILDPTPREEPRISSVQVNTSERNAELINSLNREIFSPSYAYAQSNNPALNTLWASGFSPDYRPLTCPIEGCFTEFLNEDTGRLHMNYYHNFDPLFPGIPLPNQLTSPLALLQSPNSGASGSAPPNLSILTVDQPTAIPSANSHMTMADLTSASISSANNTAFIASDFSPITYGGEEPNIAYNHWIPSPSVYTLSPTTTDQFAAIQLDSPVPNTVMDTINYPAFPTITQSQQLSLSPRDAAAYFSHYHQPAQSFSSKQPIEFSQDRIQRRNRTLSVGSGINFMSSSSSSSTLLHGPEFTPYGRNNSIAHPPFVPSQPTNNIINNNNTTTPLTRPPITVPSQHIPSTRQQHQQQHQQQQQQMDLQMPTFTQLPSQDITPPPPAPPPASTPVVIPSSALVPPPPPPHASRRRGSRVMQLIQEEGVQLRPFQVRGQSGAESPSSGIVAVTNTTTGGNNSGASVVANALKAEPSLSGYLNDTSSAPVTELVIKNPSAGSEMLLPSSAAMEEDGDDGLFMAANKCEP
ncbi:hypothetical protein HDU77_004736 [Chytriomyces hyalinus]|nr:hypothetical protein HDU77_004736 [Chytriomyces hyalinus]